MGHAGWIHKWRSRRFTKTLSPISLPITQLRPYSRLRRADRGREDRSWDSYWMGETRKLPENLAGCSIQITTGGETRIATVVEFLERRADFVLVLGSGRPEGAA